MIHIFFSCISALSTSTMSSHPRLSGTTAVLALKSPKSQKTHQCWPKWTAGHSTIHLQPTTPTFPRLLPYHCGSVTLDFPLTDYVPQFSLMSLLKTILFHVHFCLHTTPSQGSEILTVLTKERLFLVLMLIGDL